MFGNKAQMQNMLKKARKMQEDLQKKQEELKKQTVDVSVGGGAVSLTMNGEKQIVALKIAKDAIDPEDPEIRPPPLSGHRAARHPPVHRHGHGEHPLWSAGCL